MNLILFAPEETTRPLPRQDPRALHVLEVLRRKPGDEFDAGEINGRRGKATLLEIGPSTLSLAFNWAGEPAPLHPLHLIVGLPRPQTARKILLEATTLGVSRIDFVITEKAESSYAQSTLWSTGEWRRIVITGAEQAFCTRLPQVSWGASLESALASLPVASSCFALDNYESPEALSQCSLQTGQVVLALGAERGWSDAERQALRKAGFKFAHLGTRVLRAETACTAACSLMLAKLGLM